MIDSELCTYFGCGKFVEKHYGLHRDLKFKFYDKIKHVTRIENVIKTMLKY
jgi:hypothetical protein